MDEAALRAAKAAFEEVKSLETTLAHLPGNLANDLAGVVTERVAKEVVAIVKADLQHQLVEARAKFAAM